MRWPNANKDETLGVLLEDGGGNKIGNANPLPVSLAGAGFAVSGRTPVASAFVATGQSASFTPLAGRAANVSGWGTFVAAVQLERSFDGGATWLPITAAGTQLYVWSAPFSETFEESEVGVAYRLNCTAYTSGTVNYRISQ